jgi:hypothetical protein
MGENNGEGIKHVRHKIDNLGFRRFVDARHYLEFILAVAVEDRGRLLHQGLTDEREKRLQLLCHRFSDVEHCRHTLDVFSFAA